MNPLEMLGPQFLAFYISVLATAVGLALLLRRQLRQPAMRFDGAPPDLEPFEAAYLQGGEAVVINVAVAKMAQAKLLSIDSSNGKLTPQKTQCH
jgi:uncharacterized protein (TIGR04222 family)